MASILSALTAEWQFNPVSITKTARYVCRRDRAQSPGIRGGFVRRAQRVLLILHLTRVARIFSAKF
jgi:hypothetical protein